MGVTTRRARRGVLDVTVVLIPQGYASEAIAPAEIFHSAGVLWQSLSGDAPEPRFRVRIASVDGAPITSVCALRIVPELAIQDVEHTDLIVLSASGLNVQEQIAKSTALLPWLREWHARGAYIAAVCTGAAFLAESGLLDGRRATTHWALADTLRRLYPKVQWHPERFVTEDNRLFCSGGVYSSVDLSLYLVEKFCGREVALQCAKAMLLSMPRHSQTGYAVLPLSPPHADDKIREAEAYLQERFHRAVSIEQLADAMDMSPRNLIGASRRPPAGSPAITCRRSGSLPRASYSSGAVGSPSRKCALKWDTRMWRSSDSCSSVTPGCRRRSIGAASRA